jgi:hypothetical protein
MLKYIRNNISISEEGGVLVFFKVKDNINNNINREIIIY